MQAMPDSTSRTPIRILLADSGALLCEQVTAMLATLLDSMCQTQMTGYELLQASDGFEVLCRLPELRPDVLLIASDLPRLSGIQVCSLLRQSPDFSALPVLVLLGEHAAVDRVRAKMAGASACLEKPFRSADLQAAFGRIFALREASDAATKDGLAATPTQTHSSPGEHSASDMSVHC